MVAGKALASVRSTIIWVLADWWVHGEHAYGERVKALREGDISDLKFETIMTYGSVARRVGTSMRILEALSFAITARWRRRRSRSPAALAGARRRRGLVAAPTARRDHAKPACQSDARQ